MNPLINFEAILKIAFQLKLFVGFIMKFSINSCKKNMKAYMFVLRGYENGTKIIIFTIHTNIFFFFFI